MQRPFVRQASAVLRRQARKKGVAPVGWRLEGRAFATQLATSTAHTPTSSSQTTSSPAATLTASSGPSTAAPVTDVKVQGNDPITRYDSLVANGVLRDDAHQRGIIERLQKMHERLKGYVPGDVPTHGGNSWVRFFLPCFSIFPG